jgi:magnesium transporter
MPLTGSQSVDLIDRITIQEAAADLAEEIKTRSATGAAAKLAHFGGAEIAAALLRLSPGFAQDVLAALPDDARERALGAAPPAVGRQWQRNALYDDDAVARMMEPVVGAFPPDAAVGEAVDALREAVKAGSSIITYIWVVDPDQRLVGIVTMRDLLFSERARFLGEVMLKDPFTLHASTTLKEAMKQVLDRHYPVYPVVDAEGRLIGLVRGQAMFEAQAIEITLQAGSMVGVNEEERLETPWKQSLKMRHPWLQLNLVTAFLAAAVVGIFQDTIDRLVILALFLPVLAGQSGNTGCQALAVTLRGMTLGELKPGAERPLIKKEALLGALNGAGVGLAAAIGMYITATGQANEHPIMLSFVVLLAMVGSCVASGLSGALVPLTLKRLGFDPATASSIFLTTATDVVSMGMLLGLATILIW